MFRRLEEAVACEIPDSDSPANALAGLDNMGDEDLVLVANRMSKRIAKLLTKRLKEQMGSGVSRANTGSTSFDGKFFGEPTYWCCFVFCNCTSKK